MLIARFSTGFGAGTLGVLRSFVATASTRRSRIRAVSLGTAGFTSGLSVGPAIQRDVDLQICFIPLGREGFYIGPTFFVEHYVGIISDEEKKGNFTQKRVTLKKASRENFPNLEDPFLVIPNLAAPITIAMYNWTNEEAILYNGIVQIVSCGVSTITYTLIGSTRIGTWVPMGLYLFNFGILQGMAYPLISAPSNTLLSEILGPRKQGTIQGLFAFTGSMAQFIVPIFSTSLFETSGYKYIMVYHLVIIAFAALMAFILRKRLVPLELTPTIGKATKYKRGTFYRM
ncbi:hypothetical protein ANCCEY_13981 [Ancylostoma ceylanicum]|uniref:Major facilitator superfamily (MFS) profile domain-containing protein n=1 Tax=Ancylostoma ceylanicum TaxID=53326 RepID=A0A0D6LAX5_9BILA|nr:hypothetical protein ANCCEY_13981 [Ancylostoma ceylanicum]